MPCSAKMKVAIALSIFVLIAAISICDALYWKNHTGIWLNITKTAVAITLARFTLRGSIVARRAIIAWSSIGVIAMGLSIFQITTLSTLQQSISKPILLGGMIAVLVAY